jgi:UDP-glucose 4-epimerase
MTALITGGAGCIGSELVGELLRQGTNCIVYDNFSSGKREHLEPLAHDQRLQVVEGDVLDLELLTSTMQGVDFVWHFAANPDVRYKDGDPTDRDLRQNTIGTYHVLESMRLNGVKDLAYASTSAVYGICKSLPIPENHPLVPISLYGASKAACETLIASFGNMFGVRGRVFRLANIVGAKTRKNGTTVITDFVRKLRENPRKLEILGNGRQTKSYLLVSDCVEAMIFAIHRTCGVFDVYNLGPSDAISVNCIADIVVREMNLGQVEYGYTGTEGGWLGDVPAFELDVSALKRLGWEARCRSEEAVTTAVREMLPNGLNQ